MAKGKEAGRIQVYVRVRPFTDKEKEKKEPNAIALHHDHSLIRVLDPRRETNYFFDGVFGPEASNYELYLKVGRPLVYAALNGYKGTLLTYGQTGTGKTYTLLSEDGVTTNVVSHCFERIKDDAIHSYKITCSFLQVYQEKVYDLLNPRFTVELPVREHPKKGVYVANLTQNEVKSANDVLALLEYGKRQLVMAETKMVRHSSRSHSIMQLVIERRLKAHIAMEQASTEDLGPTSPENVHDSIIAVNETINNLLKELKQDRKSHHRRERECLKELMEKELDDSHSFKGDVIVKGKINLCDLAGSERLTKTKAEGVRLTEAKYLNTSLLELGNVIHALARGKQRHVPYRNSTLTRLLQDCLGDNGKTNFIVCIAPSLSEVNETKCSLNFGLRAMRIINVARLNVEMDYKVLAERLAKKLEDQDHRHKLEKLEYLREIQRLNTAVTSYEESEHVVNSDPPANLTNQGEPHKSLWTDTLVSVIQNLSKSVQREKEAKHSLQSELTCLKKKVSNSPTATAPDIEALFLAELMSMQLLTHVYQSEAVFNAVSQSELPSKVRDYMTSTCSQENMLLNTGYMLQLLESCLGFGEQEDNDSKLNSKDYRPKITKDVISPADVPDKGDQSPTKKQSSYVQNMTGGLKKMFGLLVGNKDFTKEDVYDTKSQHGEVSEGPGDKAQGLSASGKKPCLVDTKQIMTKLVHTKEKVEKHAANLLLTAFGEQLICSQGNSPQWGVLGRKLSELIMFKRNNIIGIKDTEMWSNYENVANILESCFKYVLIDKALLASMIVIEHMDGRGLAHKHLHRLPSPGRTLHEDKKCIQTDVTKEFSTEQTNTKHGVKGIYDVQDAKENLGKSLDEIASPSKYKIGTKSSEAAIELEINEVFDDTSRLETELFATMEEKARLEDELIVMKDYVNKLRSNMFHLKIEQANLESDLKKTAKSFGTLSDSVSSLPQKEHFNNAQNIVEDYKGLRVGELSDVTEASYESTSGGESENGSQVSEGTEQGSQVLKNCLASMTQMYSLMPNPDDDTLTEGDDSDGKGNGSLSEDDIGDSDEDDIIITKIAREMQDFHSPSLSKDEINKAVSLSEEVGEQSEDNVQTSKLENSSTKTIKKQACVLNDALEIQSSNKTLKNLQIAYEDLEDELYHVRAQLSKAQQIILNLEFQLSEEKGNWEQIRKLYLENKDKNDVLEGKVAILREELEKSLRENTFLKDYHKVEVVEEGHNKPNINSTKSPLKSPSKRKGFDLRSIPSIQNSNREMQIIKLLEENTELKTRNEKLSEEKMLAEHHSRERESKAKEMEERIRYIEEGKRALQEEIETLQRRKAKLGNELLERREESLISSTELDLYSKESARLEKELAVERNMVAKLRHDNSRLTTNVERFESELGSWKKQDRENVSANEGLQMVFIDDDCSEKESHGDNEEGKMVITLQKEIRSMAEYHEALEKEYTEIRNEAGKLRCDCQVKEERIKSLENEIEHLRRQMLNTSKITGEQTKTILSRLHLRASPSKTKTAREEVDVKERYEGSARERDYKNTEDEIINWKQENGELRQKIRNSEQKIAIYEADLEKAMLKIRRLQEYRVNRCLEVTDTDPNCKSKESNDLENYSSISAEMKLSKANKEIERLQEQLLDKDAEKGLLHDELHLIRLRKDELDKALDEARDARTELQEKMEEMGKCTHFDDTVKELTEKNIQLDIQVRQSEETALSAVKRCEKQNEALRKLEEELVCASGEKLKSEFELRNAVIDMEKARNDLQQSKQDLKMLNIELNDKIERSANLEIQLLELKCSNECVKSEIHQLKEKTRLENHQNQEQNICKETMEKRLQETFVANNQLQSELHQILEQNKHLNENLCKAQEWKENAEQETSQLQEKLLHMKVELNQAAAEKKQLEGKVKKLDDTKRKMEEEFKLLRENTHILQSDLGKIEKQQEETNKKCSILEKEIKGKTKELEGKQRDIRRLRKELSINREAERTLESESTANHCEPSDEVKKRKAKVEESKEATYSNRDYSNQQVGSGSEMNNTENVACLTKDTHNVIYNEAYDEIGWDFENDTVAQNMIKNQDRSLIMCPDNEKQIENQPQTKQDLSDEVGWNLNDFYSQENSLVSSENSYSQVTVDTSICIQQENCGEARQPSSVTSCDIDQMQQHDEEMEAINAKASVTQISKEKLLLESETARLLETKTSHLTKTQMSLEQSLSKALGENKRLLDKLNDSRVILERIKARVSKLEEQNDYSSSLNRSEAETQTIKMAEVLTKSTQMGEIEVVVPVMEDKENAISEVNASSSKAILYLTREKKQVAKELEITKRSHEDAKKELHEKEKISLELKQELKTLNLSHEQEKQSLLKDLETIRGDYNTIKRKLKEQEEYKTSSEKLKEKHIQAERLIVELEKDLMRQTEEKASLKGKLADCQNKLKELDTLEKEMQSLRNENRQMSTVQEAMAQQMENYRKENQELLERLEKRKKSWNTSRQRRSVAGRKKEAGFCVAVGRKTKCMTLKEKHTKSMQNRKQTTSSESRSSEESDDSQDDKDNVEENTIKQTEDNRTDNMGKKSDDNKSFDENLTKRSKKGELDTKANDNDNEAFNPPEALVNTLAEDIPTTDNKQTLTEDTINSEDRLKDNCMEETSTTDNKQTLTEDTINSEDRLKDNCMVRHDLKSDEETSTTDNKQTLTEDTINSEDRLKDNCMVRHDLKSDEETEEEANIELKLSKILKERQMMEVEMQTMLQEMNNLKAKFALTVGKQSENSRQSENNSYPPDDKRRTQLEHLQSEKNEIQEQVMTLKSINTKLEVEVSDALDVKLAMEAEITRIRTASQEHREKTEQLNENIKKLESVLAVVVEENSTLYQEVSTLREENQMLKNHNIREIVDGSTQVSPRATEDEADSNSTSLIQQKSPESPRYENKIDPSYSKGLLELPIQSGYLVKYQCQTTTGGALKPLSASSPDTFGKADSGVANTTDENSFTSCEFKNLLTEGTKPQSQEERDSRGQDGGGDSTTTCSQCRTIDCQCQSTTKGVHSFDINQKTRNTGSNENPTLESLCNDHDLTSGDVCTDSSFASITDFEDISFSSDWVSAEDLRPGHSTSKGHRGISKMHREMAEIKCTNTILENELTIMKNRNTDFQAQLQKLSGKNNSLKQKVCDRSLAIKKAEREMTALIEEKMRFEVQVSASREEINRLERERGKLERSLSNSKSENKRLKNDLAMTRAESYKTMKTLVNLEAEYKKLQTEFEETREQLKRTTQLTVHKNTSLSTSLEKQHSCNPSNHDNEDRSKKGGLSLQLATSKTASVRRVSSDQALIPSSEPNNSPEDFPLQERKSERLCKSQILPTAKCIGEEKQPYTEPMSLTQSDDSESSRSETSIRMESQMSYSSDLSFPDDGDQDSNSHSDEVVGCSGELDDKKPTSGQGGIKKMFKRFSKSKKTTKSFSS